MQQFMESKLFYRWNQCQSKVLILVARAIWKSLPLVTCTLGQVCGELAAACNFSSSTQKVVQILIDYCYYAGECTVFLIRGTHCMYKWIGKKCQSDMSCHIFRMLYLLQCVLVVCCQLLIHSLLHKNQVDRRGRKIIVHHYFISFGQLSH